MPSRFFVTACGWLCFCCGGRAAMDASASGTAGTAIMAGTAGATGGTAAGGTTSRSSGGQPSGGGGSSQAGQTGVAGTGGIDWAACAPPDTCVLETQTACGAGCEPVPLSRFIPVNSALDPEYKKQQLVPPCISGMCPAVPPSSIDTPNYYAACEAGRCVGIDVRQSPLSACTSDAECYVRAGTSCCGCGSDNLIAVSSRAQVEAAFCGTKGGCAADCAGGVPPGVTAYCSALGHCLVSYPDASAAGGAAN